MASFKPVGVSTQHFGGAQQPILQKSNQINNSSSNFGSKTNKKTAKKSSISSFYSNKNINKSSNSNSSSNLFASNLLSLASIATSGVGSMSSSSNENLISPKSDKSDSSLNLNNSMSIQNPLKASFEDSSSGNLSGPNNSSSLLSLSLDRQSLLMNNRSTINNNNNNINNNNNNQSNRNKSGNTSKAKSSKKMRTESMPFAAYPMPFSQLSSATNSADLSSLLAALPVQMPHPPPPVKPAQNKCTVAALLSKNNGVNTTTSHIKAEIKQLQMQQQQTQHMQPILLSGASTSPAMISDKDALLMAVNSELGPQSSQSFLMFDGSSASSANLLMNNAASTTTKAAASRAPKPPRTKTTPAKKPQTKLRDYFTDMESPSASSSNSATVLSQSTKQIKKEMREMMAAAQGELEQSMLDKKHLQMLKKKRKEKLASKKAAVAAAAAAAAATHGIVREESSGDNSSKEESSSAGSEDQQQHQLNLIKKANKSQLKPPKSIKLDKEAKKAKTQLNKMSKKKFRVEGKLPARKQAKAISAASHGGETSGLMLDDEYNDLDLEAYNAFENTFHSQLVFEIVAEDGFRVVSYDINSKR